MSLIELIIEFRTNPLAEPCNFNQGRHLGFKMGDPSLCIFSEKWQNHPKIGYFFLKITRNKSLFSLNLQI